ncbi:MAG TPA: DUF6370 family protein [Opitutaceae bacterium]|nr:DUF6370 family protein [Opitutaceae bacterium]
MKKTLFGCLFTAALMLAASAFGANATPKEITVSGLGRCGKCALHESKSCQNTVTVKENGKDVIYWLTKNDVSEDFHDNICRESQPIKVTGVVKEVDGKKEITPSKIELAKD